MTLRSVSGSMLALTAFIVSNSIISYERNAANTVEKRPANELYVPAKVWRVPENNNYDSDTSEYSYQRKCPNIKN